MDHPVPYSSDTVVQPSDFPQAILRGEGHSVQPLPHGLGELGERGDAPLPDGPRPEPQEHEVEVEKYDYQSLTGRILNHVDFPLCTLLFFAPALVLQVGRQERQIQTSSYSILAS